MKQLGIVDSAFTNLEHPFAPQQVGGIGLLTPGCGLCHAVFSMNNKMSISFLADCEAMPDPDVYLDCAEAAPGKGRRHK